MTEHEQFLSDRLTALRSLCEPTIRAYGRKYGAKLPEDPQVFWSAVHKARVQLKELSEQEREYSRRWLKQAGSRPLGQEG